MAISEALIQKIKARANQQGGRQRLQRKAPVWQHPDGVEREYRSYLLREVVGRFRDAVEGRLLDALPALVDQARRSRPDARDDQWGDDVERLIDDIRKATDRTQPQHLERSTEIARGVSDFNRQQFQRIAQATLGVTLKLNEPYLSEQLDSFARENARLIKSIPGDELDRIEGLVQRGLRAGRGYDDLAKEVRHRVDVSESRSRLIARDQTQKLNSNLTELRQKEVGVRSYIWQTSRDERVRSRHAANQGKEFRWDDPPSSGHPGAGVNCRCYAAPVLEPIFEQAGIEPTAGST